MDEFLLVGVFATGTQSSIIAGKMSLSKTVREENHAKALKLFLDQLEDQAFDTTLFDAPFSENCFQ